MRWIVAWNHIQELLAKSVHVLYCCLIFIFCIKHKLQISKLSNRVIFFKKNREFFFLYILFQSYVELNLNDCSYNSLKFHTYIQNTLCCMTEIWCYKKNHFTLLRREIICSYVTIRFATSIDIFSYICCENWGICVSRFISFFKQQKQ